MIKEGHSHLIFESEIKVAYRLFSEMTAKGKNGLFISTTYPSKLEKTYDIRNSSYIWLSDVGEEGTVDPRDLNTNLREKIGSFAAKNPLSCIFLDTVESIYADNEKKDFFEFMKWFSSIPSKYGSTVILPMDPAILPRTEMDRLASMFDVVMDVRSISIEAEGKECPRCGAIWNPNVTLCSICGYEFGHVRQTKAAVTATGAAGPAASPSDSAPSAGISATSTDSVKNPENEGASVPAAERGAMPEKDAESGERVPDLLGDELLDMEIDGPAVAGNHGPGSAFKRGVEYEKQGLSEKAIESYREALKEAPNDPWTWINMGVSYQRLAMSEEALRCYDNAIKLNPTDADAWSNRAIALRLLGKIEEAVESYDRALAIDPGDAGIWSNKGVALRALGRVNEALECYEQALAIDPYDIGTWLNKAVLLQRTGHIDEALECYDEILRMDPYHPVAMKNKELLSRLRPQ